jgi:DNA-binding transcriptional LysR family regulator
VIQTFQLERQVARLTRPKDIADLPFVANTALRYHLTWSFSLNETERQVVTVHASIFLDATHAVREAVCQGAGLSVLPEENIAPIGVRDRRAKARWSCAIVAMVTPRH